MDDNVSRYFAAPPWEPLCAVGGHDGGRVNAQVCISAFSASIVPDRPRVALVLWKSNLTHDLVLRSGTAAVTLLAGPQLGLIEPLGLKTGHDGDKLAGLDVARTVPGDPYFPGGAGYVSCETVDTLDLGDATLFVTAVVHEERLSDEEPMTWAEAQERLDRDLLDRYRANLDRDIAWSRARMRWR